MRQRIGMERVVITDIIGLDESSLRRIEREDQHPSINTLKKLFEVIDLPIEGFIYPLLDELPMGALLLCDRFTQALDMNDLELADTIFTKLEEFPKFETGVLTQFKLSSKARLWELKGYSMEDIIPLVEEGMTETFGTFTDKSIADTVLILEEPELMHTKARLLAKSGKLEDAILILENMITNLSKIPSADKDKERQYVPVILTLIKCLMQKKEFDRVMELCVIAEDFSAARKYGYFNPDLQVLKAEALKGMNKVNECKRYLQNAYFGFVLLGETKKANETLVIAKNEYNICFPLYGVDKLTFSNYCRVPYNRGETVECFSFGTMIRTLRERMGLSLRQLCRGICSQPTLLRIENEDTLESFFTIEAIMQRLGRDINLYKNFFLSRDDFILVQLRDRIYILIAECKFSIAAKLIDELEKIKRVTKSKVIKQFIKMIRAILFANNHDEPQPEFPIMLTEALHITCPQYNEKDIEKYHLTFNEIAIISQIAGYYGDTNNLDRSVQIYNRLCKNINANYSDEVEKARTYSSVLFNYSSTIGRAQHYAEAIEVITEGENFERNRGRLIELPSFLFNRAYILLLMSKKEECIPYFALSYYGASLFSNYGQEYYLPIIQGTMRENFGFDFD